MFNCIKWKLYNITSICWWLRSGHTSACWGSTRTANTSLPRWRSTTWKTTSCPRPPTKRATSSSLSIPTWPLSTVRSALDSISTPGSISGRRIWAHETGSFGWWLNWFSKQSYHFTLKLVSKLVNHWKAATSRRRLFEFQLPHLPGNSLPQLTN